MPFKPDKTPGRGRRGPGNRSVSREERVQHIMTMGRMLYWKHGVTSKKLAAEWEMAVTSVEDIACEAWRRLAAELKDPDAVKAEVGSTLRVVISEALEETREPALIENGTNRDGSPRVFQESPNGARRVVVEASKALALLVGANAATKVQLVEPSDDEVKIKAIEFLERHGYAVTAPKEPA